MPGISIQLDETNVTICIALPRIWFMAGVPVPVPVYNERQKNREESWHMPPARDEKKNLANDIQLKFAFFDIFFGKNPTISN